MGNPGHNSSPNGFRLDSTQSSWLMDRLNALNEEDKIAMAAHAQRAEHDGYNGPQNGQRNGQENGQDPSYFQQGGYAPAGHDDEEMPPQTMGGPEMYAPRHDEHEAEYGAHPEYSEQGARAMSQGDGHSEGTGNSDEPRDQESQAGDYQMMAEEDPSENARLLRERIETLERQIAEISRHTQEKPEEYREELIYRGVELGKLKAKEREVTSGEGRIYRGVEVQDSDMGAASVGQDNQDQTYELSPEELAEADYEYLREQLEPRLDNSQSGEARNTGRGGEYEYPPQHYSEAPYQPYPQGYDQQGFEQPYRQMPDGPQTQDAPFITPQQAPHSQDAYYQERQQGLQREESQPALPQFLNTPQQQKIMRPRFINMIGMLFAALVIGSVGYFYLGEGVSDVVKSDFNGFGGKEAAKLSDIVPRRNLEVVQPKLTESKALVVAVNPAQLAAQFKVEPLIGEAGKTIDLPVQLPNLAEFPSAFLVLRNMPDWASVDSGRLVNGAWIISQNDASQIKVEIPEDQPGTFAFVAELVFNAGEAPIAQKVNAVIAPVTRAAAQRDKAVVVGGTPASVEQPEQIKTPEVSTNRGPLIIDQALEEKWLERGTRLLRAGDVAAARLAFSHLAEQGSGRGALAMGMTFDPNQPSSRVVAGIDPDVKRARFWYQRALALGNESAREQLRLLASE